MLGLANQFCVLAGLSHNCPHTVRGSFSVLEDLIDTVLLHTGKRHTHYF